LSFEERELGTVVTNNAKAWPAASLGLLDRDRLPGLLEEGEELVTVFVGHTVERALQIGAPPA
jgi:hypothetical protein